MLGSYRPLISEWDPPGSAEDFLARDGVWSRPLGALRRRWGAGATTPEGAGRTDYEPGVDEGLRRRRSRASRSLLWQQELLDGFRRGWQRGDCANEVMLCRLRDRGDVMVSLPVSGIRVVRQAEGTKPHLPAA